MELQKILRYFIIALIILLPILAVVGGWLFFSGAIQGEPVAQEPVATTTPQTLTPPKPSTPVPQATTTVVIPPPASGESDEQKEYNTLFDALGATQVKFATTTSGEIYTLYAANIAGVKTGASSTSPYALQVAMIDLTADKVAEAIVYNDVPGFCGSGGCAIDIWQKNNGSWQNIFEGLGYQTIGVTESTTGGYKNLLLSVHGEVGFMTKIMQYVFKDGGYQEWNLVAVWNGFTFAIPQ